MSEKKKRIRNLERRTAYLSDMLDIVVEQQSNDLTEFRYIKQQLASLESMVRHYIALHEQNKITTSPSQQADGEAVGSTMTEMVKPITAFVRVSPDGVGIEFVMKDRSAAINVDSEDMDWFLISKGEDGTIEWGGAPEPFDIRKIAEFLIEGTP